MDALLRVLHFVFFLYFLTHIPISIFVDSVAIVPDSWHPQITKDLLSWYAREFHDSMMAEPPAWFKSFCYCELFLQLPFFPVAAYAFWKGNCRWIRIPAITYASHVATTVWAILVHIWRHDFQDTALPSPRTFDQKLTLTGFYFPYLLVPILILVTMIFHPYYTAQETSKSKRQ